MVTRASLSNKGLLKILANENIDRMLFERHISKEQRRKKHRFKGGMKKRTKEDDEKFRKCFVELLERLCK